MDLNADDIARMTPEEYARHRHELLRRANAGRPYRQPPEPDWQDKATVFGLALGILLFTNLVYYVVLTW